MKVRKFVKRTEFYLAVIIIILAMLIEMRSGQFFTGNNLVDLLRSVTVPAMFAVCIQMVIISGGVDLSGPAIASLSMFAVTKMMLAMDFQGNVLAVYGIAAAMGLLMGALNGFLIAYFEFPTMIVTLGTSTLFQGIMYGPLKATESRLPDVMYAHGSHVIVTVNNAQSGLSSSLPVAFVMLIILVALAFFILKYTMLGRGIYAIGGDKTAATRAGFHVFGIQMFIYCFVGTVAGIIGVVRACMMLNCHPSNLLGMEMTVIAAVVLGGTKITGGYGTLTGAMLGIFLMTMISNSLILVGISTYWQDVFTGAVILIGTGISLYSGGGRRHFRKRLPAGIKKGGRAE